MLAPDGEIGVSVSAMRHAIHAIDLCLADPTASTQQCMNDTPVIRLERYSCSDRAEHARRGNVADIVSRTTVASAAGCTALENHQMKTMPTPIPPKRKRCLCRDRRSLRPKRLFSCLIAVDSTDLSRPEPYLPEVTGSIDNLIVFIKGCLQSPKLE